MKPKLLAVSATDTVPAILCVAATGSDPAQGSDTSVAAAMLSSKLFFDGAGTHRPLPERKAGHISVLSGGSSADGAGVAGTVDYRLLHPLSVQGVHAYGRPMAL